MKLQTITRIREKVWDDGGFGWCTDKSLSADRIMEIAEIAYAVEKRVGGDIAVELFKTEITEERSEKLIFNFYVVFVFEGEEMKINYEATRDTPENISKGIVTSLSKELSGMRNKMTSKAEKFNRLLRNLK